MHEFILVKSEIERVLSRIEGRKVKKVVFSLGRLAHSTVDSITEAFQLAANNTPFADAEFEVANIEPQVKCSACGNIFGVEREIDFSCPKCESKTNELIAGNECCIGSIQVE